MKFYIGLHHVNHAADFERCMISVNTLKSRKKPIPSEEWIMDSGAFTQILQHGQHVMTIVEYAERVRTLRPTIAVCQDWMCEPEMISRTGKSIKMHQELTIANYRGLLKYVDSPVMPVLQGYDPKDYASHIDMYGGLLREGAWCGVGSVCKRNSHPSAIREVLLAVKEKRPDLRLHGFGVKTTSLCMDYIRDNLYSADSMAWSYASRYEGGNGNSVSAAKAFHQKIENQNVQTSFQYAV